MRTASTGSGGEPLQEDLIPTNITWTGSISTNDLSQTDVTGLSKGTKYYFIAEAKNSGDTGSGSELSFLTKPDAPTSLSAPVIGDTQIDLQWTKGAGANRTMVRRKTGNFPTSVSDGTQVYYDTSASVSDTNLTAGTTYFYRIWSEVSGSQQWSDSYDSIQSTTTGTSPTAIGGIIYPVNKTRILVPWLLLLLLLSSAIAGSALRLRKRV
ncbi:hypothetical protein ACFLVN_02590 [Chloroflexota bacterium]